MGWNVWFMIQHAWREKEKKVLLFVLLTALLNVAANLVNLYITPSILSVVERRAALSELITMIALFTGTTMLIRAANAYIGSNTLFGRVTLRIALLNQANLKSATTSYPNLNEEAFGQLLEKSNSALMNNSAASEAIWNTLTALLEASLGFVLYVLLLAHMPPVLLGGIVVTSALGYVISKRARACRE